MTSLVLSIVVMTSSGGLLAERVPAAGLLMGAVDLNAAPIEGMSLTELTVERTRLMSTMPSAGLGVALTAIGGGVFLTGFTVFLYASILVGVVIMVAAIPLLIIGPILLVNAGRERRAQQARVFAIDRRIATMGQDGTSPLPPQNDEVPPPPPVRPPDVERATVAPQLLLATF